MRKVILAGVCLKEEKHSFDAKMKECEGLCQACGYEVVGTIVQNSQSMDKNTGFRSGKIEELVTMVKQLGAELVVFCNSLSVSAALRIKEEAEVSVIDRTSLILDIFATRATSRQSRLQVEMARLKYALPTVRNLRGEGERSRGGSVNNRGSGEMRSALVARRYRARIAELKKELAEIENRRCHDERRRSKTMLKRVALVGYTNAGKSSLLNVILKKYGGNGSQVMSEDMLFATLDTSVRLVQYHGYAFLLYDTVGFVSDMPEELLDAFYSTLSAASEADLLVHVLDASEENRDTKITVTEETLTRISAQDIPLIRVANKTDLLADNESVPGIPLSCVREEGIDHVMDEIITHLYPKEETFNIFLPYDKMAMFDEYRKVCSVIVREYHDEGMDVTVSGTHELLNVFRPYRV